MSDQEKKAGFSTDQQHIAGVYAKSLIDAAEKAGNTETVLEQLDSFVVDVLGSIVRLADALESPRVSQEDKTRLIDSALSGKADPTLVNFLKVLNAHSRLDCLRAINSRARSLFNELRGRVEAFVTVADEMPQDIESSVAEKLKSMLGKEVILNVKTDPEIIGGMIVKVDDTVYDSSVANQLAQVREAALERTVQKVRNSLETFAAETENESN
ncbi:MAG: ATP synthase F1 subunit delta [Planctomycetota bacterium]|nr:ATP synthase F1 subunit delta [Planctomycetota bacterium]